MNQISDDNDFQNSLRSCGLIYTTSNGEYFGFGAGDIHCMVKYFDNRFVTDMYVSNGDSYIEFDTGVGDNKSI